VIHPLQQERRQAETGREEEMGEHEGRKTHKENKSVP